ncbi:MAG: T9SS type A sorting domain-containing protein, partial [Bacteroidota bacterium]
NEMISCVPYISDEAWKVAFTRQPAMNEWHLAQVLLESSPLKKTVIQMMDTYNLGSFYKELVLNGQNGGLTHLMILESELNAYSVNRYKAQQDFAKITTLLEDEVANYGLLTSNLNPDYSFSDAFLFAALQLTANNLNEVQSQMVKDVPEDNSFDVLSILMDAEDNIDRCEKFSADQLSSLSAYASKENINGSARAAAAVRQQLDSDIDVDLRFATSSKSLRSSSPSSNSLLSIYPNPVKDKVYITTDIPEGVSKVTIEVIDIQGATVKKISNIDPINIIELSIGSLPVGIYVCKMYFDGIEVQSEKLIIIR